MLREYTQHDSPPDLMRESTNRDARGDLRMHWAAAALSLVLMLVLLGTPPVQRTQEARVLEVAREMLGKPLNDWLIPRLDGEIRLQKPPLAYWFAAAAFEVGGVREGVGRVPFALVGWLTILLTAAAARWLFGSRAGFLAGTVLLGSLMFARHARLAETDILATLFVTAAIVCIWRGMVAFEARTNDTIWFAFSGILIGLALLAKGPPALFVLGYLAAMVVISRRWIVLWRWCRSGAPIFALLVGLPWFIYAIEKVGIATFREESRIALMGEDHPGSVWNYIPDLMRAIAPWTALTIMAIVIAGFLARRDWRLRGMLVWLAAIMVPLFIIGQRQYHYILPAMPPLAILTAWLIDRTLSRELVQWRLARGLAIATFGVVLAAAVAIPFIADRARSKVLLVDWITGIILAVASVGAITVFIRSRRSGIAGTMAAVAIAILVFTQSWLPSLQTDDSRAVAFAVRAIAPGPVCFYGENVSIPLMFNLRRLIPRYHSPDELSHAFAENSNLVVIVETKAAHAPPPLPADFHAIGKIESDEQVINVYQRQP